MDAQPREEEGYGVMEIPQVQYHSALDSYLRIRNARKQAETFEIQKQSYEQEMSQRAEQMRQQGIEFEQAQQDRAAQAQSAQAEQLNARKIELGRAIRSGLWDVVPQYGDVWESYNLPIPDGTAPSPEELPQVQAFADFFDPEGVQKPVSVAKGADLVDPNSGRALYTNVDEAAVERARGGGEAGGVREQKIKDTMATYGLARGHAAAIVDGVKTIEIVPQTGMARLVDKAAGTVEEVPIGAMGGGNQPSQEQPSEDTGGAPDFGGTLWDMAEFATGPVNAAARAASVPLAWAGLTPFEKQTAAKQRADLETQNMIRAIAVNPRFPVAEMDRLREEINLSPKIFDDPALMKIRMKEIDTGLRNRLSNALADANDPNLPVTTRSAQAQNAVHIQHFLEKLGVPKEKKLPKGLPKGSKQVGYTKEGKPVYETPDGKRLVDDGA